MRLPMNRRTILNAGGAAMLALGLGARSVTAAPRKGGRLRLATTGGAIGDSLDPAMISDYMAFLINWACRNNLVEVDENGNLIPELATSWEPSPDARTWTFDIRKGVEFHNGKSLVAEDVIYSINHHRGEDSRSAAKVVVAPIQEVRADGDHRVIFTLNGPNADFPYLLSDQHLVIAPTGTSGEEWDQGIGTGGYVIQTWNSGESAFMARNPNYWKQNRAHFDEVEIIGISDVAARTNALASGEVDLINNPDLRTAHLIANLGDLELIDVPGSGFGSFPMHSTFAPFNDPNVRLALKYAIDREEMVQKLLFGHAVVGNDHPIAAPYRYHAAEIPQRQYDPDKAKYHLNKAGLTSLTVDLSSAESVFNGAVDAALLFKETAFKAGIEINLVREPADGYWSNVWLKKPFCASHWNGRSTEDWILSIAFAEDAAWNEGHWKHPQFNALLQQARAELDDAKRRELYTEMQMIVRDEGSVIIPFFDNYVMAASKKLAHGKIANNWHMDGLKLPERWWFA